MKLGKVAQQPAERQSYSIEYSEALTGGDGIETAVATSSPEGLVVESVTVTALRVQFWVSGGSSGVSYKVTVTANTKEGRTFQDELTFKIKEV